MQPPEVLNFIEVTPEYKVTRSADVKRFEVTYHDSGSGEIVVSHRGEVLFRIQSRKDNAVDLSGARKIMDKRAKAWVLQARHFLQGHVLVTGAVILSGAGSSLSGTVQFHSHNPEEIPSIKVPVMNVQGIADAEAQAVEVLSGILARIETVAQ